VANFDFWPTETEANQKIHKPRTTGFEKSDEDEEFTTNIDCVCCSGRSLNTDNHVSRIQNALRVMLKLAPPLDGSMETFLRRPMHSRLSMSRLDSLTAMSFSRLTFVFCRRASDWTAAYSFSFSTRIDSRISRTSACSLNSPSSVHHISSSPCSHFIVSLQYWTLLIAKHKQTSRPILQSQTYERIAAQRNPDIDLWPFGLKIGTSLTPALGVPTAYRDRSWKLIFNFYTFLLFSS